MLRYAGVDEAVDKAGLATATSYGGGGCIGVCRCWGIMGLVWGNGTTCVAGDIGDIPVRCIICCIVGGVLVRAACGQFSWLSRRLLPPPPPLFIGVGTVLCIGDDDMGPNGVRGCCRGVRGAADSSSCSC